MDLLHLEMFHGANVLEQLELSAAGEAAEGAMVDAGSLSDCLTLTEVHEEEAARLVALSGGVKLKLVGTVRVVVTRVTAHLYPAGRRHVSQLPLISGTSLLDVIHVLKALQMFVRLTVQLEIRLQVRLVGAQLADVVTSYNGQNFLLPDLGAVCGQVVG